MLYTKLIILAEKDYTMDDSARNLYAEFHDELASGPWIARGKHRDDIKGESPGKPSYEAKVLLATIHNMGILWDFLIKSG